MCNQWQIFTHRWSQQGSESTESNDETDEATGEGREQHGVKPRRKRRTFEELERNMVCDVKGCGRRCANVFRLDDLCTN
jgi:hypothetical protein